jgi:hypothetical protein
MAEYQYRKNDGKWRRVESMDDLADAIYDLGPRGTIEIKQVCEHEKTWNDHGIRTCENCGQQLEVTSYRD